QSGREYPASSLTPTQRPCQGRFTAASRCSPGAVGRASTAAASARMAIRLVSSAVSARTVPPFVRSAVPSRPPAGILRSQIVPYPPSRCAVVVATALVLGAWAVHAASAADGSTIRPSLAATFTHTSYAPGERAMLVVHGKLRRYELQILRAGAERSFSAVGR